MLLFDQQPTSTSDPFLDALKKREAAVKVADITFQLKEVIAIDNDLLLKSTNRFVIQGARMRFAFREIARTQDWRCVFATLLGSIRDDSLVCKI